MKRLGEFKNMADFRSDTITKPTQGMLEAMIAAEVGDDVLGDDPTVRELEEKSAGMLGKEAAVFVPSGTMGNQASIAAQTKPGEEIILDSDSHCIHYEAGGLARIACVQIRPLRGKNGAMDLQEVENAIRPASVHLPRTALIVVEQSHMNSGGCILPLSYLEQIKSLAENYELKVHMDGARLFNASVASGVRPAEFASFADSVTFCLSKGLCCPAGSVICGSRDFIEEVRHIRKFLGGGMRQSGYLAACGIFALDHLVARLAEDHERAKRLAEGLGSMKGLTIENPEVQTNLVFVRMDHPQLDAAQFQELLEKDGVRAIALGPKRIRFVTHREIEDRDVDLAIDAAHHVLQGAK